MIQIKFIKVGSLDCVRTKITEVIVKQNIYLANISKVYILLFISLLFSECSKTNPTNPNYPTLVNGKIGILVDSLFDTTNFEWKISFASHSSAIKGCYIRQNESFSWEKPSSKYFYWTSCVTISDANKIYKDWQFRLCAYE